MEYLVVDGYNVINAWRDLFDLEEERLEESRTKLLNILSNYQGFQNINVIVVFDAHMVKGSREKQEYFDNLLIVFTKENVTADNYIERFVYRLGNTYTIRVVTSDYLEQTMIMSKGGIRVSPRELREEVELSGRGKKEVLKLKPESNSTISSRLKPEMLELLEKIRRSNF